ncbi:hypothetical protein AALO_G00006380 [Alosa alosa]|uniref:Uncharacterized protein n=1 Tax=Alosa alosa TaxID=278164 RepID=A0AAV6HEB3_9TELE|nr:hypothetical protein AALO_G00006380 [Alosa alosa]
MKRKQQLNIFQVFNSRPRRTVSSYAEGSEIIRHCILSLNIAVRVDKIQLNSVLLHTQQSTPTDFPLKMPAAAPKRYWLYEIHSGLSIRPPKTSGYFGLALGTLYSLPRKYNVVWNCRRGIKIALCSGEITCPCHFQANEF